MLALGDVAAVFPRSAVKAMQALPLIESGAADRFGFGEEELALACASHGGEPAHVAVASAHARGGRARCRGARMRHALAEPSRLGRGAGARGRCAERAQQQLLRQALRLSSASPARTASTITAMSARASGAARGHGGARRPDAVPAVGGPVRHRRLLDPDLGDAARQRWHTPSRGSAPDRAWRRSARKAAARLRAACAAQPYFVAGTGRFCTEIMTAVRRARLWSRRAPKACSAARCPSRASASRSNATTAARGGRGRDGGDDRALPAAVG